MKGQSGRVPWKPKRSKSFFHFLPFSSGRVQSAKALHLSFDGLRMLYSIFARLKAWVEIAKNAVDVSGDVCRSFNKPKFLCHFSFGHVLFALKAEVTRHHFY